MAWLVWLVFILLMAIGLRVLGAVVTVIVQSPPSKGRQLTPKQEELNRQALITRKRNANRELHAVWTHQFSNLQIQAQKARLEASKQDKEKE